MSARGSDEEENRLLIIVWLLAVTVVDDDDEPLQRSVDFLNDELMSLAVSYAATVQIVNIGSPP
jgi:hypothetical protein